MKRVTITVGRDGETTIEADGFAGEECLSATDRFRRAAGGEVVERSLKPEFHEVAAPGALRDAERSGR